jgi:hypothetical protein
MSEPALACLDTPRDRRSAAPQSVQSAISSSHFILDILAEATVLPPFPHFLPLGTMVQVLEDVRVTGGLGNKMVSCVE